MFLIKISYVYNGLHIYDGPDEEQMKIREVFGNSNNKLLKSISSSGKSMYIDFKKLHDFGYVENAKTEFKASVKYKKKNFDCQTLLDAEKNILTIMNININCSWLITSYFESHIILDFKFIEVNSCVISVFSKKKRYITFSKFDCS